MNCLRFLTVCCLFITIVASCGQWSLSQETRELVTEADLRSLRTNNPQYFRALGASSLTQTDTNLIRDFTRIQVLQMTLASNERLMPDIREKIKREIDLRAKQPAKDVMLPEIVKHCRELLNYSLPIQLNAVMLVTELNEHSGEITKDIPPTPYQGMVDFLLEIIGDPNRHESLKVAAVNGLLRICRDSNPKVDVRSRIAEALVKLLDQPNASEWLRMITIQALARTDVINDSQRRPFVVQRLTEILVDPQQGWRVRADAAYALGRVQMDGNINVPLITHEIARFAHEMALRYNTSKEAPHWRYCAYRLYLAFRPEDAKDTALMERAGRTPLSKFRNEIQGAYGLVLPVVNEILESMPAKEVSAKTLEQLNNWIQSNRPASLSVSLDPNVKVKPIRTAAAAG